MTEEILVNLKDRMTYEAGAVLLTVLALPGGTDLKRGEVHASLCALALRTMYDDLGAPEAMSPQLMKQIYALRDPERIEQDRKMLFRRFRDRMVAARMAIAYLKWAETGEPPELPGGKRVTLNNLSDMVLATAGGGDSGNVETRVWRPSLPVIHVAAAVAVVSDQLERADREPLNLNDLLFDPQLLEIVVNRACFFQKLIEDSALLPGKLVPLIRCRLVR